jgi:DNA polymerase III gamma/tau subunit
LRFLAAAKEEQQRLRLALKILSDAEKQLRVAADRGTWLTAALLQFAPDRSFLPSEVNTTPSPVAAVTYPVYGHDPSEPEPAYAESKKHPTPDPEENVATFSEQKLEEAWAGEPPPQQDDDVNSESTPRAPVELQVFEDTALAELWKRVVWEVTPRNLKNLLQTHGRLVAAGVAIGKHLNITASIISVESVTSSWTDLLPGFCRWVMCGGGVGV